MSTLTNPLEHLPRENCMCEALDDHEGSVSIGGRLITKFCFADDIVVNEEEKKEAGVLLNCLDRTTTKYKMESTLGESSLTKDQSPRFFPR